MSLTHYGTEKLIHPDGRISASVFCDKSAGAGKDLSFPLSCLGRYLSSVYGITFYVGRDETDFLDVVVMKSVSPVSESVARRLSLNEGFHYTSKGARI